MATKKNAAPPPPPAAAPVASTPSPPKGRGKSTPVVAPVPEAVEPVAVAESGTGEGFRTSRNELVDPISEVRYFPNKTVHGERTSWVENQLAAGILKEMGADKA